MRFQIRNLTAFSAKIRRNTRLNPVNPTAAKYSVVAAVLLLTACNHPQPGIQVQAVEVPVPQPCLAAEDIPPEPPQVGEQLTGNAASDLLIVAASALNLRAWGITMQAALKACAE